MEIADTTLYVDAMRVMANRNTKPNTTLSYALVLPDEVIDPFYQASKTIRRDYVVGYADEIELVLAFGIGTYAKRILPNRANLKVRVTKIFNNTITRELDTEQDTQSMEFTAILSDVGQNPTVGQGREADDEDALNLAGILEVSFQLIDPAVEQLKATVQGGVPRQCTPEEMLITFATKAMEAANTDEKIVISKIDVDKPNNTNRLEQLVVPHGLPAYELPRFLQSRCGVYSAGLGTYIQNQIWYTYPLYDTSRFANRSQQLTVLVLPKTKFPSVEVTYDTPSDGCVTIITTSETAFRDDSGTQSLNHGNGVRFSDEKSLDDALVTKGNKAILDKSKVTNVFTATKRENGVNFVAAAPVKATSNPYQIYSQLSARSGGLFKFIWENSQGDLLTPGMAAKVVYFDEKEVKTLDAVLVGVIHVSTNPGGMTASGTKTASFVSLFVREEVKAD